MLKVWYLAGGISIIWEFVRSVNSQIPPHCGWIRHSQGEVLPFVNPLGAGDELSSRNATWENTWALGTGHKRMMFIAATMYLSTRLFLHSLWAVKYYNVMKIKWRCQQTNPEEKQGNDHHKIPENVDPIVNSFLIITSFFDRGQHFLGFYGDRFLAFLQGFFVGIFILFSLHCNISLPKENAKKALLIDT